jgi:hypothetical protein
MDGKERDKRVEPLFAALEVEDVVKRTALRWKLFWAGIVLLGLILLVLKQSF